MSNIATSRNFDVAPAGGETIATPSHPQLGESALRNAVEAPRQPLDAEAIDSAFTNRWWEANKQLSDEVEGSLYEGFQLKLEDESGEILTSMDVLNCTPTPLSPADMAALQHTVKKVSDFTDGKIFSRVNGIVLSSRDKFENNSLGGYRRHGGYLRVNFDELRKEEGDELAPRYKPYFKDQPEIGTAEVNLAHELGHSLDLHSAEEAEASKLPQVWDAGVGMHKVSAFHGNVGWRHSVQDHEKGLLGKVDHWNLDDAAMTEQREFPPTTYAASQPAEDFAESFAIAALNGDTSTLDLRTATVKQVIEAAEGAAYPAATGVALDRVAG